MSSQRQRHNNLGEHGAHDHGGGVGATFMVIASFLHLQEEQYGQHATIAVNKYRPRHWPLRAQMN